MTITEVIRANVLSLMERDQLTPSALAAKAGISEAILRRFLAFTDTPTDDVLSAQLFTSDALMSMKYQETVTAIARALGVPELRLLQIEP